MPTDLPKTTVKFLIALLKHQAKTWLGEDAAGLAAQTLLDEDLQKRLDDWLNSEATAKQLLQAAEQAQRYLQDPRNCPDDDLRHLFRDLTFGDLSPVQAALADLPQAMGSAKVQEALRDSFARDLPLTYFGIGSPTLNVLLPVSPNQYISLEKIGVDGYIDLSTRPEEEVEIVDGLNNLVAMNCDELIVVYSEDFKEKWFDSAG